MAVVEKSNNLQRCESCHSDRCLTYWHNYTRFGKKYRIRGDNSPQGKSAAVGQIPRCLKNRGNRTPGDSSPQSENAATGQLLRYLKGRGNKTRGGDSPRGKRAVVVQNAEGSTEQETGENERPLSTLGGLQG